MKRLLVCLLAGLMVLSMAACGSKAEAESSKSAEPEKVIGIKLGANLPQGTPITDACFKFKEELEKRVGGKVEVKVFPAGQLGGGREMLEACQFGNIQMVESTLAPLSGFNSEFLAFNLPYLFKTRKIAYEFLDGPIASEMKDSVIKDGFKILSFWDNGYRNISNSVRPIRTPADLKGLKIRTMENPVHMEAFRQMGANPTPMAFTELFTALQLKTVDGEENAFTNIASMKLNEVQKYISTTAHFYDVTGLFINPEFYDSLSPDIQKAIVESAKIATDYQREQTLVADKKYEAVCKTTSEITYLTDAEIAAFKEASKGTYAAFEEKIGKEKLARIIKALEEIEKKQ